MNWPRTPRVVYWAFTDQPPASPGPVLQPDLLEQAKYGKTSNHHSGRDPRGRGGALFHDRRLLELVAGRTRRAANRRRLSARGFDALESPRLRTRAQTRGRRLRTGSTRPASGSTRRR